MLYTAPQAENLIKQMVATLNSGKATRTGNVIKFGSYTLVAHPRHVCLTREGIEEPLYTGGDFGVKFRRS